MFVLSQSMHGEIGSDQKMKVLVFSDSHGNETNMITAIEQETPDLVLYGHTHQRHCEKCGRFYLMNPGSVGMGSVSYGVLYLEEGQCRGVIKGVFSEEEYYAFAD